LQHYEIDITKLSESERSEPHLRAVFDLLVRTNPAFDEFVVQDNWWGWARKSPDGRRMANGIRHLARSMGNAIGAVIQRSRSRSR
jgi:hypothetical protein